MSVSPRADSVQTSRIMEAEVALASLHSAVSALSNGRELCEVALRCEAVAAAGRARSRGLLGDLLLFEAASPIHPARGIHSCHAIDAAVAAPHRYLVALTHGYRRVAEDRSLTADALIEVLVCLTGSSCTERGDRDDRGLREDAASARASGDADAGRRVPDVVVAEVADLAMYLRTDAACAPAIVRAAITHDRLARLGTVMKECVLLGRIAALLLLHEREGPPLPIVLRRSGDIASACDTGRESFRDPGATGERGPIHEGAECDAEDDVIARFAGDLAASASDAMRLVERTVALTDDHERRIAALSKAAPSAYRVHRALQRSPVIALPRLLEDTGLRAQAAMSALHRLRPLGIVREVTGRHRHRVYSYDAYIEALATGADSEVPGARR